MTQIKGTEYKIFDPRDGVLAATGDELLDASVVRRNDAWWMCLAGQARGHGAPNLFSATLPKGNSLSAEGWTPLRDASGKLLPLADNDQGSSWNAAGGRHCPAYVKGWDLEKNKEVERIYYAGGAEFVWGPYAIGYLEWDGSRWIDQATPCFEATEDWEHGSVYEPNVLWHEGKWKMWYVAGSNQSNYLVHGYAESNDGIRWGPHTIFAPEELKMFDFCVRSRNGGYDAIFSRLHLDKSTPPSETGLWWCHADTPSGQLKDWSTPVQIMNAEDKGWHSGPFKPSFQFAEDGKQAWVFFNGMYHTGDASPFPFALTLGCLKIELSDR